MTACATGSNRRFIQPRKELAAWTSCQRDTMTHRNPKTYVVYHENCADGFGAAWAAHRHLGDKNTIYMGVEHGNPMPEELVTGNKDNEVFIFDFSFEREEVERVMSAHKNAEISDHHISARDKLKGISRCHFDMERSGAMLAWNRFFPEERDEAAPALIRYVQDCDLWKWELPGSREVSSVIASVDKTFAEWDALNEEMERDLPAVMAKGVGILRSNDTLVRNLCEKNAYMGYIAGMRVPIVNSALFQSEIGERLLALYPDAPFAAIWYENGCDRIYSLRSRPGVDVSAIARDMGGGGHKQAAGFNVALCE